MLNSTITNLINLAFEVSYNYDLDSSSGTGSLGGLFLMYGILSLVMIVSQWKIFTKAGKPGWASIVPVYNMIVMIQIADLSLVYLLLLFIPIANIYALFKIYIGIAHKFGKSTGFGVGLIFLTIIFMPMLAFGDAVYEGNSNTSMNNDFNNNNNNFRNHNQSPSLLIIRVTPLTSSTLTISPSGTKTSHDARHTLPSALTSPPETGSISLTATAAIPASASMFVFSVLLFRCFFTSGLVTASKADETAINTIT